MSEKTLSQDEQKVIEALRKPEPMVLYLSYVIRNFDAGTNVHGSSWTSLPPGWRFTVQFLRNLLELTTARVREEHPHVRWGEAHAVLIEILPVADETDGYSLKAVEALPT